MPAWVLGTLGGVLLLFIIIEEAGQYIWKRYVEEEPVKTRRSRIRSPWKEKSAVLLQRIVSLGAMAVGKFQRQPVWKKVAFFAKRSSRSVSLGIRPMVNKATAFCKGVVLRGQAIFGKAKISERFSKMKALCKRFIGIMEAGLKNIILLLARAVKLCIAGAASILRKYRKSSSHS
ncbi:hypothetical protein [Bacillus sp. FJAT-27445]|uniref:hypothetical protein n=1 Tax=Bacillus sp. FJAT-27445 TaxID=1679166 RepID=UPI0007433BD5|nr:hypothetical protein [Bacillus sp. FJAT-27445]